MIFSIIIPVYNGAATLADLLHSITHQTYDKKYEIILIDDNSADSSAQIISNYNVQLIRSPKNQGPAACRNMGAKRATGKILVFTDSDCRVDDHWLANIEKVFAEEATDAVMGKLIIPPSSYVGDSISALGFPAGGSMGFDRIWQVDSNGYTDSLSTCNCAVKKDIFEKIGGFDQTFPLAGGEDTLLAYNLRQNDYRIKYCPDVKVFHAPRTRLTGFISWQFRRGVSSYIFSTKIRGKKDFVKLRLRAIKNIIQQHVTDRKLPLIFLLLFLSYSTQVVGYLHAKHFPSNYMKMNE